MFGLAGFVLRNEQLTGPACSKQLDSYKNRSHYHRMNSVHSDGIDWMEIWQWLAIRPTECHVPTEVLHGSA